MILRGIEEETIGVASKAFAAVLRDDIFWYWVQMNSFHTSQACDLSHASFQALMKGTLNYVRYTSHYFKPLWKLATKCLNCSEQ